MTIEDVDAITIAMLVAMNTTHSDNNIWPSLETASRIFDLSSISLAIGACVVFVSTALIVWLGIVKEHHWDVLREEHREKIASLAAESEKARADVEKAHAEIANANKAIEEARADTAKALAETAKSNERAAELKLALEREIAARQPRHITQQQRDQLIAKLATVSRKGKVSITAKLFDEEAIGFAKELLSVLKEAGFEVRDVRGPMGFGVPGQWILVRDLKQYQTTPSWAGEVQTVLKEVLGLKFDGREMDASFKADIGEVLIAIGAKS